MLEVDRRGQVGLEAFVTNLVAAEEAPQAFAMLDQRPQNAMQEVLDHGGAR